MSTLARRCLSDADAVAITDTDVNIKMRKLMKRHLLYKCIYIIKDASKKRLLVRIHNR